MDTEHRRERSGVTWIMISPCASVFSFHLLAGATRRAQYLDESLVHEVLLNVADAEQSVGTGSAKLLCNWAISRTGHSEVRSC